MTEERKEYIKTYQQKRQMNCYPSLKYIGLIKAYAEQNSIPESSVISHAVKCFFDTMTPAERHRLGC